MRPPFFFWSFTLSHFFEVLSLLPLKENAEPSLVRQFIDGQAVQRIIELAPPIGPKAERDPPAERKAASSVLMLSSGQAVESVEYAAELLPKWCAASKGGRTFGRDGKEGAL